MDELSAAAKVCTLSSPSACKKNGSFTSFFEPPRSSQRQMAAPPPLPPLCGRQVAMLLAFTVGRHTQKRWVRKDSVPLWTPCRSTLTRRVSMSRRSLTFDLCHFAQHTAKKQRRITVIALQHLSVHVGVSEWGLEGKYSTSRVHIFLYLREVIKTQQKGKKGQILQELYTQ